jgi:hypothetical protein
MTRATIAGLLIVGIPVMAVAIAVFWRRQRAVIAFALALVTVGLGYLAITGAAAEIARALLGNHRWIALQAIKPSAESKPPVKDAKSRSTMPLAGQSGSTSSDSASGKRQEQTPRPTLSGTAGPQP